MPGCWYVATVDDDVFGCLVSNPQLQSRDNTEGTWAWWRIALRPFSQVRSCTAKAVSGFHRHWWSARTLVLGRASVEVVGAAKWFLALYCIYLSQTHPKLESKSHKNWNSSKTNSKNNCHLNWEWVFKTIFATTKLLLSLSLLETNVMLSRNYTIPNWRFFPSGTTQSSAGISEKASQLSFYNLYLSVFSFNLSWL
jgi:hypothetical protein